MSSPSPLETSPLPSRSTELGTSCACPPSGDSGGARTGSPPLPIPTIPFTLSHGDHTFNFVMPADFDDVFNAIVEEQYEKDRFLPYWAERWPSSAPFFSFVMNLTILPAVRICELGCGLGVIAAGLAGKGHRVIATDIAADGCRFAYYNIFSNDGIPLVVCADWRHPPFRESFDLIVASDILYEERWIGPILDYIEMMLAPGGEALIADPCRRFWEFFKQCAKERGFLITIRERTLTENRKTIVEIVSLRRS